MAAIIPLDESVPLRVAGLLRLQRRLAGKSQDPYREGGS